MERVARLLSSGRIPLGLVFFAPRLWLVVGLLAAKRGQTKPLISASRAGSMGAVACSLIVRAALALSFATVASADDALVLPKGRMSLKLEHLFSFATHERWNPQGRAEALAGAFDGRALDSSLFSTLAVLDPLVPGGRASIGDSAVHFEYQFDILRVTAAYGITDQLTLGLDLLY